MTEPLPVAVIGLGSMGANHVRIYSDLPGARLVGLADIDADRQAAAQRFAPDVPAFSDYRTMLAETRPAAVTVAVPTLAHLEVGLAVLDAGAHVLIEKPIASDIAEGSLLIRAAQAAERLLMVGHIERFNPAVRALKTLLATVQLGQVYQIQAQRVGPAHARIRDVGVVYDLAPHDIDIMRYLIDEEVERVYAETEQRLNTEHEDMLLGLIRFRNGVVGVLDINWLTPEKIRRLRVLGEKGTYELDYIAQTLDFAPRRDEGPPSPVFRIWPETPGAVQEPLRLELIAFLEAVRSGGPPPVSGADALAALDLAAKLVQSGLDHRPIEVSHPLEVG